jgi:hypothetical protein
MKALGLATCMAKVGMMLPAAGARCVVFVYQGGGGGIEDAANLQGKPQTVWGCVCTGC